MKRLHIRTSFECTASTSKSIIHFSQSGERERQIFYEFAGEDRPIVKPCGNFALMALFPFALHHGLDIEIDEPVDFDLLEKLEENRDAWLRWNPQYIKPIRIYANTVMQPALPQNRTAVVAFSGGLDASYALHAHKRGLLGRRALDVTGAVLVQGFDLPLDQPAWFAAAKASAQAITDSYGISLTTVSTNWRELGLDWEKSFIFALTGVMHQFKTTFGYGVISTDESYESDVPGWGSNGITNQMMSGISFPIQFTGGGISRTGKAEALMQETAILNHLRVCWENPASGNCGHCEKCIRTKLNFLAHGVHTVPALGGSTSATQVNGVLLRSQATLNLYKEILKEGDWSNQKPLRQALRRLVERGVRRKNLSSVLAKYKKSIVKRIPKSVPFSRR